MHKAIALIAVIIRVLRKLPPESAAHPVGEGARTRRIIQGGPDVFPQNGTQALRGEDLRLLPQEHLNG